MNRSVREYKKLKSCLQFALIDYSKVSNIPTIPFYIICGKFLFDDKLNCWSPQWPSRLQLEDAWNHVALPDVATNKHVQPAPGPEVLAGQALPFSAEAIFLPCEPRFSIYPATHPHRVKILFKE